MFKHLKLKCSMWRDKHVSNFNEESICRGICARLTSELENLNYELDSFKKEIEKKIHS